MKPAPFEYFDPRTVEEAVALLREHGEEAKILAGGQSLMPLLNMRMARPEALVDLSRVAGLDYIREADGALRLAGLNEDLRTLFELTKLDTLFTIVDDRVIALADI